MNRGVGEGSDHLLLPVTLLGRREEENNPVFEKKK